MSRSRKLYLFSYGSNSPRQLAERVGHSVKGQGAFVSGHLRAFRGWSNRWEGGVATLIPGRGNTYGYIAEVTPDDLAVLDRYEGVATGNYRRANLTVTTIEGETVQAIAYLASSTEKNAPSRAYKQAVAETIGSFWKGENGPVTESDITVRNNPRRRNTGESVLEILVALDKRPHSEGYVVAAASRTKAQYQVRGLTFRDTTEGSTPAIAVRFDIDTRNKGLGGNWYDVFELFEYYLLQDGAKHNAIIGYNLSGLLRQQKSAPPGEREALAIFRQVTAEGKASPRKKAAGARAPKPVYTKAYLAEKGMKRRNPLDMYRKQSLDGEVYFSVPFANHTATLDIQFDKTDWYRPGAAKTLRVLRTSHMAQRPQHGDLGHYGTLVRRLADAGSLTADDLLTAAIKAEASANDMLNAYPRYKYRDAAHYYEGLTEVLTDLAASLQKGWQS